MPMPTSSLSVSPAIPTPPPHRLAALAAAEARLRGDPPAPDADDPSTSKKKEEVWAGPKEKDDRESRLQFGRLLDRGIVRDNGYRQSAEAVEVGPAFSEEASTSSLPVAIPLVLHRLASCHSDPRVREGLKADFNL